MYRLGLAFVFTCMAFGQDAIPTFQLKNSNATALQEIATTLRTVADIKQLTVDPAVSTIALSGSPEQIAVAEWLIPKLDVIAPPGPVSQKYNYGGNTNDVVEVLELKNAPGMVNLQEILTTIRTVADVQKIYQSSVPKTLILRSDPGHIAMVDFIVAQLDQPAASRKSPVLETFQPVLPGNSPYNSNGVMVYGLVNVPTVQELQTILTALRVVLHIQKIYQNTATKSLTIRADAEQLQMAQWLIPKMDTAEPVPGQNQMAFPGGKDDVVKVFYVPQNANLNNLITSVRTVAKIPVVYQNLTPAAIVVRSTADQLEAAGKLLPQM